MKYAYVLIFLMFLFSCNQVVEKKKEEEAKVSEVVAKKAEIEESLIPMYSFSELVENVFAMKNDTTYVVNFWATWCKPCVEELPAFEKLTEVHKDDAVKVVLVSLDFPERVNTAVVPFMTKHDLKSEVVLLADDDANTWIPKVDPNWDGAIPVTVIFKNEKKKFYSKSFSYEELEKEVQSL